MIIKYYNYSFKSVEEIKDSRKIAGREHVILNPNSRVTKWFIRLFSFVLSHVNTINQLNCAQYYNSKVMYVYTIQRYFT